MSIVRMLRATIVGRTADAEATLTAVQAAGLLHLAPLRPPADVSAALRDGDAVLAEVAALRRANSAIANVAAVDGALAPADLDAAVAQALGAQARREQLMAELAAAEATLELLEPFGDFDAADLDLLAAHGAPITLVRLTWNDFRALGVADLPHLVCQQGELELLVALIGVDAAALPVTPLRLPRARLADVRAEVSALRGGIQRAVEELGALAGALPAMEARLAALADREAVLRALGGGLDEGEVFAVQGYLPAENQVDLQRAVAPFQAMLLLDDPKPGEEVPVKLLQPAAVEGFAAIVRSFSGISYWEKDFTAAVMVLFLVFGSLCLLDAGYGLLLAITGGVLLSRGMRAFGMVFLLTGGFSTLVGVVGGQYFGLVVGTHVLKGSQPPTKLASDAMVTFNFSLIVGLIGMTFSYIVAVWQRGLRTSATGSLSFALGANALAVAAFGARGIAGLLLAAPSDDQVATVAGALQAGGYALLGAGVLGWFAFPDPTFGEGKRGPNFAWQFYSGATGLGQDVMSHMRLFGIALSGSIMAMVVNQIAGLMPLPLTIAFGAIGHVFVFVLSLLSLYIHTNRLIFLEFGSKCFSGGHAFYEPLRRGSSSPGQSPA